MNGQPPGKPTPRVLKTPNAGTKTIRRIRVDNGWTQKVFANKLGISASYLSQVENGSRQPSQLLKDKIQSLMADSDSRPQQHRV